MIKINRIPTLVARISHRVSAKSIPAMNLQTLGYMHEIKTIILIYSRVS